MSKPLEIEMLARMLFELNFHPKDCKPEWHKQMVYLWTSGDRDKYMKKAKRLLKELVE